MSKISYDELVQLRQGNTIGHLEFLMNTDNAADYLEWCEAHNIDPSDESAEFYSEMTEIDVMELQAINDEDYGIWN